MHWQRFFSVDWAKTFIPTSTFLETFLRGTLLYFTLVVLLRFALKRERGELGTTDLLVLVLLGDAAQNAMAGNYSSVTDGLVLILTLVFWSAALNWLAFRFHWIERLLSPRPLALVRDGQLLRRNMRKELVTEEELRGQLRLQGIQSISQIRAARMEADGRISVITYEGQTQARGAPENDLA